MKRFWHLIQSWLAFFNRSDDDRSPKTDLKPKLCPSCNKLLVGDTRCCPYCQFTEPSTSVQAISQSDVFITQKAWPVSAVFSATVFFYLASLAFSVLDADYHPLSHGWAPKQEILGLLGASHADFTLNHAEYWRLITSPFIHTNLVHIIFNLVCFAYIGVMTLYNFGLRRFWLTLGACAMMANIFSADAFFIGVAPFHATGLTSVLFGLAGLHYVFFRQNGDFASAEKVKMVLIWSHLVFLGLTWINMMPIDNFGHLGAMLTGMGLGYWYDISQSRPWVVSFERLALFLMACFLAQGWYQIFLNAQAFLR